ncbi:hypothetical protein RRG08_012953 [Elysia crispata]|uniref:Uncharacterized protein n=1 Tax=Elysia crispata TaxID=231223 RepID=A0AAE1DQ25_9GAST|nr:hypothetical protein RRG08_012953 [Elysia crispata]
MILSQKTIRISWSCLDEAMDVIIEREEAEKRGSRACYVGPISPCRGRGPRDSGPIRAEVAKSREYEKLSGENKLYMKLSLTLFNQCSVLSAWSEHHPW